jgi:hypothetical protein
MTCRTDKAFNSVAGEQGTFHNVLYIYTLYIYDLFNDAVSSSGYIVSNGRLIIVSTLSTYLRDLQPTLFCPED